VAREPNCVWSWDITKLKGPKKGEYFDLYVVLDIFSRYVVGWCVMPGESAEVAKDLIESTLTAQGVGRDRLTIHADRGSSMTSNQVAELLAFLGVGRSHSRRHVSNDNPFSEAQFKTLKYCPACPERFGSLADARAFCERFFSHYNHEHRHSGIGFHTPASVHYGTATEVRAERIKPSTPPTPPTRCASDTGRRRLPSCPPSPGSTSRARRPSRRSDPRVSPRARQVPQRPRVGGAAAAGTRLLLAQVVP